jgi:hypothetical protein
VSLAAHQAAVTPAPTCPGYGHPMAPTPAGHHTCSCDGTTPAPYDLPRGHDRPMRKRERRIRTTTAVDVWDDYQPEGQKLSTSYIPEREGLGWKKRKGKRA